MAVNGTNPNTSSNQAGQTQAGNGGFQQGANSAFAGQQQTTGQPTGQTQPRRTFRQLQSGAISRGTSLEAVNAFLEHGNKVIEQNGASTFLKLIKIPTEVTRLESIPVMAIFRTYNDGGQNTTVVRPIIYGTESLATRKIKVPSGNGFTTDLDIESAPGDVYTDNLWNAIEGYLRNSVGIVGRIVDAAALGVPHHFIANENTMPALIANVSTMIDSYHSLIDGSQGADEIDPSMFQDGKTEARLDFNPKPIFDSIGNPIRADWAVSVSFTENGQQQYENDFMQNRTPLINVYGYVDLIPVGSNFGQQGQFSQQGQFGMPGQFGFNGMAQSPYCAMVIITHMETHLAQLTPGLLLLGLHAMTAIMDNQTFTRVWRPKVNQKIKRTIGALGLEIGIKNEQGKPAIVDVTADDASFFNLVNMCVGRNPLVAMDVEETGDSNTITQLIRMVAANDPNSITVLTRAANAATGGNFQNIAQAKGLATNAVAQSDNNRIALGHYTVDGNIYDRREVDRLALLTVCGATDMIPVQQYDESLNNMAIPAEVRMHTNWNLVNNSLLASCSAPTGYARRVIINGAFLAVLNDSFRAAQVNLTANSGNFDGQTQRGRDYSTLAGMQYQSTNGQFQQNNGWGAATNGFSMGARANATW